jgi:hypothetical protein
MNSVHELTPSPMCDWNKRCAFLVTSKDGGLIFDIDHRRFRVLDTVAAEMWKLLNQGKSEPEVVDTIARLCNVDRQIVAGDLKKLLASAADVDLAPERVFVTPQPESLTNGNGQKSYPWYGQDATTYRPQTRSMTVLKAFIGLIWSDRVLSKHALKGLCRRVSEWPIAETENKHDPELIGRICGAVEKACVWYRKPAVCLQRSAVTTCLLRSEGVAARMVVASKVMPLEPHAWVEVAGYPVNDFPKVRSLYLRFVSF